METRPPDFPGGICTTQHAAEIIISIKSVNPPQGGISRPIINLIQAALEEFGIHLQLEDIAGGVLLFWKTKEDFEKSDHILNDLGTKLRERPVWTQGHVDWELKLLKPTGQKDGQHLLDECRNLVIALFGIKCEATTSFPSLTFRAPTVIKFLDVLWQFYQTQSKEHTGKEPRLPPLT